MSPLQLQTEVRLKYKIIADYHEKFWEQGHTKVMGMFVPKKQTIVVDRDRYEEQILDDYFTTPLDQQHEYFGQDITN